MILLKLIKSTDIMYVFAKLKKYHILLTQTPVLYEPCSQNLQLFMRFQNFILILKTRSYTIYMCMLTLKLKYFYRLGQIIHLLGQDT